MRADGVMAYDMRLAVTKYTTPCPLRTLSRISLSYRLASRLRAVGAALPADTLFERPRPRPERKKTDNPREGWEDGTPPPHRDFKERCVVRYPSPTLGSLPLPIPLRSLSPILAATFMPPRGRPTLVVLSQKPTPKKKERKKTDNPWSAVINLTPRAAELRKRTQRAADDRI